jgi:uncharacterized protein YecE (DUF72 family)
MSMQLYIGTSGWHYDDWTGLFYPPDIKGYRELTFHAQHFNTVENNSSFYRIAGEGTYTTWDRMTPDGYVFSMKLNKLITHTHRLAVDDVVRERVAYILDTTQVLGDKLGAILIQLPASFTYDLTRLDTFLAFFTAAVRSRRHVFDIAIELRNRHWFTDDLYALLERYNVALVAGQSSRWPGVRQVTADIAYIRMHGPDKLFASSYSDAALQEWAAYITGLPQYVRRVYVYFNNDFHGYALQNATTLSAMLGHTPPSVPT